MPADSRSRIHRHPWHDISDLSALDSWTPETGTPQQGGTSADSSTESQLPTDGDRIVFTGTVGTYSYEEVIALQAARSQRPLVRLQPDLPSHRAGYSPGDWNCNPAIR